MRRGSGYPYGSPGSFYRGSSVRQKPPKNPRPVFLVVALVVVLVAAGVFVALKHSSAFAIFPKKLLALRFQHNGQEVLLLPDQQAIINPRDSLQLVQVRTDGWLSWGTRVVASDANVKITSGMNIIKDLFPQETFETPKTVELRVLLWNRQIGKVSLLVQLDARDWVQRANATSDVDKKIGFLEKALHENASNILVKTQLAGLYVDTKQYADAMRLYREIDNSGKSRNISERLLQVYQIMNRVDDSLRVYLDLLKITDNQDQQQVFKDFMAYLKKKKQKDDAEKFLDKHLNDIPRTFHPAVLVAIAELSSETKNWSRAAASYERAIKAGVKDSDVLYNLFVSYKRDGNTDKALDALEKYVQKNPNDTESVLQLAELYEKKGNLSQAKAAYEAILHRNPQHKGALTHLVAILEKGNDKAALQAAYEKLARMQPKNRTLQHNLAVLYYESKQYDKAIGCFKTVAALEPGDLESRRYMLDIYRKLRNEKGELAVLQDLIKIDSKNVAYQDALFKYYDDKKDFKGMNACFKAASEQNPDSVRLHNYLLYAAMKMGDKKAAARELEQLVRLQPKDKTYLRKAADLYEGTGQYSLALKKLDMLIKVDPKDKQAKDDYLRLRMLAISKKN